MTTELYTHPVAGHTAWYMDRKATLDTSTGLVQFTATFTDHQWFGGFTGGVTIFGTDQQGDILATTPASTVRQAGVCGTSFLEPCDSQRTFTDKVQMTGDYQDVTDLVVMNWRDGHNRLMDDLNQLGSILKQVGQVASGVIAIVELF